MIRSTAIDMRMMLFIVLSMFGIASSAETEKDEIRIAVEAVNQKLMAALLRGDSAAVADLYTKDGQVFPPYSEAVSGRPAVERFWRAAIDSGIRRVALTTSEVVRKGDSAYEVGNYAVTGDKHESLARGKYIVIWKREQGRWKLHRDIMAPTVPWTH
jgi:uncharacterized protein (TIGR02246 family)